MRHTTKGIISLAAVTTVMVTGCSTKAASSNDGESQGGVKTDVGVDADTIHLGLLTDLSGPFKGNGLAESA